ncbi:carbonic anhydrase [Herbiconiux sp. SYSU D00978]|uniref:carbonic anhydrase n=1 Tax=Herbiconiux sp. SYSU D00978 TaxID=2812562 RepID=UPI001A967F00|nr:carbonic anhydrase [Herbiconiux sp. SYSU D00978]
MTLAGDVWNELVEGNRRFVDGSPEHPRQDSDTRASLAGGQSPRVALLGCADSRLAAEIIFDTGLGDLFVVRNAGQVAGETTLASLEFAVSAFEVPLIVVLAHDSCGAVKAAVDTVTAGANTPPRLVREIVERIEPAVRAAQRTTEEGSPVDPAAVGLLHLESSVASLVGNSEVIAEAVATGRLAIVGANYDLARGVVATHTVVGEL